MKLINLLVNILINLLILINELNDLNKSIKIFCNK